MGQPVMIFKTAAQDSQNLLRFYTGMFDWQTVIPANRLGYGIYVEVEDVSEQLQKAESLGGTRMMGPEEVMEGLEIGLFNDPEGHVIGVLKRTS